MPRSRISVEALQWFGLLAGPLAFAAAHVAGFFLAASECNPAASLWQVPVHAVELGVTALAALVVVAAEAAAALAYAATNGIDREAPGPPGRIRFLATAALVVGPIFLALVLLGGVGSTFHPECRQA